MMVALEERFDDFFLEVVKRSRERTVLGKEKNVLKN